MPDDLTDFSVPNYRKMCDAFFCTLGYVPGQMTGRKQEGIGDRVRKRREALGLSQARLAELVDVRQQTISDLEAGRIARPRFIISLVRELKTTAQYLQSGEGPEDISGPELSTVDAPLVKVPVVSWVEAGRWAETVDPYQPGTAEETIRVPSKRNTLIALRIKGRSMNVVAPEGSTIIIDYADKTLVSGGYYVIKLGNDKATFKRYKSSPDRFEPHSTEDFETIFPTGPVQIVGRVIRVERSLV